MKTLLQIQSSIFSDGGQSSQLANRFVENWRRGNPGGKVVARDLAVDLVPHLDAQRFGAFLATPEGRTSEQTAVVLHSDTLIAELKAADVVVLGLPMYNFGLPSTLKAYFDHIARAGVTFKYTDKGPVGLLTGKELYVFATRGGAYAGTPQDTQSGYVRDFFAFLGITKAEFVYAEGLAISPESKNESIRRALAHLDGLPSRALALCLAASFIASQPFAAEPAALIARSVSTTPTPPWPPGDQRGMANTLGAGTTARCAWHMSQPKAHTYELSYVRSSTMPLSAFSGPYVTKHKPTASIPGTAQAFNLEGFAEGAEPGQQATQIDALGHFGYLPQAWDGKAPLPIDEVRYYGGYTQKDVRPTLDSPLLKLGIEMIRPIITSAVVLDAKALVGGGQPMKAGELVTAKHIEAMLKAQGLAKRGILPGDVVYVRTGWGDYWRDPDTEKFYYTKAPGLSYDAAKYLGEKRIVAIGLDTPFIDAIPEGMLAGKAGPAAGVPDGFPFALHHYMLTQMGIHHVENVKLDEIANDKAWTSCTMILPQREKGSAGAAVRPVAIGVPGKIW